MRKTHHRTLAALAVALLLCAELLQVVQSVADDKGEAKPAAGVKQ